MKRIRTPRITTLTKTAAQNLTINYTFARTEFGDILLASTPMGTCYIGFVTDSEQTAQNELQRRFPTALFQNSADTFHQATVAAIAGDAMAAAELALHLIGTPFQINVWQALLTIPFGERSTYGKIAAMIGAPTACRAVGTAIGTNPVALIVPCHRVILASGALGNYRWGAERKAAMLAWEAHTT